MVSFFAITFILAGKLHFLWTEKWRLIMTAMESVNTFYKRLSKKGYTKPYLQNHVIPDWWEDEAAKDSGAFYEFKLTIARRLGLDLKSILDQSQSIRVRDSGACHFKTKNNHEESKNTQALARTLAEMAAASIRVPYLGLPESGCDIRKSIISKNKPWVGFIELLDYLWSNGVPVLFLANIHPKWLKMEGMVTMVNGRPVIILAKNTLSCAWQLFILAHEVGHIVKGHLNKYTTYADKKVDKLDIDPIEQEATHAAIEMLTSDGDTQFVSTSGRWLSSDDLAMQSIRYGQEHEVDPGHIALNYGYQIKQISTANSALKIIEPESNAPALLARKLIENLDEEALPEDSYLYLLKMCGADA